MTRGQLLALLIATLLAIGLAVGHGRYELRMVRLDAILKLDRWTGRVWLWNGEQWRELANARGVADTSEAVDPAP